MFHYLQLQLQFIPITIQMYIVLPLITNGIYVGEDFTDEWLEMET